MTVPSGGRGPRPASTPHPARNAILLLLSLAAGCVDAASFLGLGQVLTAAMTGNTVLLGLALGRADLQASLRSMVALLGFFAGVLLGAAIIEPRRGGLRRAVVAALGVELALLLALAIAWQLTGEDPSAIRHALIAAAGLAMGVQSAIAHRIGVAGIATTFVSGTLTTLGARLIRGWRRAARRGDPLEAARSSWLPAAAWLAYGAGAAFAGAAHRWWPHLASPPGAVAELRWTSAAMLLPVVAVTTVLLMLRLGGRRPARR